MHHFLHIDRDTPQHIDKYPFHHMTSGNLLNICTFRLRCSHRHIPLDKTFCTSRLRCSHRHIRPNKTFCTSRLRCSHRHIRPDKTFCTSRLRCSHRHIRPNKTFCTSRLRCSHQRIRLDMICGIVQARLCCSCFPIHNHKQKCSDYFRNCYQNPPNSQTRKQMSMPDNMQILSS